MLSRDPPVPAALFPLSSAETPASGSGSPAWWQLPSIEYSQILTARSVTSSTTLCNLFYINEKSFICPRAVDPHSYFADPDLAVILNADLDPAA